MLERLADEALAEDTPTAWPLPDRFTIAHDH